MRDREVQLVGVGDLWAGELDPARAFEGADGSTTIALTHNPDSKDALSFYKWALMLCGHTHGGQVALPLIGRPLAPVRDRRFVAGLHAWRDRQIYITRGVGNLYGLRLNCRPEVSLLRLS